QQVRLMIYNILGQTVNTLVDGNLPAGSYEYTWNGRDARGQQVASGIYLYSLETGSGKIVRKMLLAR
ncbi:MAG: T9SS type A sorting domain-containing protein, partial [Calditrichaeota bacterium]|nr:T9SS type A sorting domain-containing protein [Calditrichota bacterium]